MRSARRAEPRRCEMRMAARPCDAVAELPIDLHLRPGVQGRGRLVEHHHLGVAQIRPRHRHLPPLTRREVGAVREHLAEHGVVPIAERSGHLVGPGPARRRLDRSRRRGDGQGAERDVVAECQMVPLEVLEHRRGPIAAGGGVGCGQVDPVDGHPARSRAIKAEQALDQRGLAGTLGSHQRHALADPVEHRALRLHTSMKDGPSPSSRRCSPLRVADSAIVAQATTRTATSA